MNKNRKRNRKKNADRRTLPSVHVLIAVIAIIECLVLLSFTTYSWIESNSSLVIMNGPQTTIDDAEIVNIDIADTLNYEINLDNSSPNADLNTFYRFTENYRYGKGSSPDGTTFYFPKRNNTYSNASTYRKGDTTDYNTSYTYFDFYIKNTVGNRDFFFADKDSKGNSIDVFSVVDETNYFDGKTYTDGGETKNKLDAIKSAMRLSITTVADNQTTTTIYSPNGSSYQAQNGLTDNTSDKLGITTEKIDDYGFNKNTSLNANSRKKLFTSTKSATKKMKVSVRIWFEIMDPDFQKAFGFGTNQSNFNSKDFNAIAGVAVNVNLTFANNVNNFIPFYFDDYTFDSETANAGRNMTLANENNAAYKVWFHVWNPDINGYSDYEMERDTSVVSSEYTRWEAQNVPQVVTDHLQGGITTAHLNASYFTYGLSATANTKRWYLYAQPGSSSDFVYKAYSQTYDGSTTYGVGAWDTQMTLVRFNDMSTRIVTSGFNNAATAFRYMNTVAVSNPANYYVFVNRTDAGNSYASNFTADVTRTTAAMYYDSSEQVFKAYVPTNWISDSGTVYFNFSRNGQFNYSQTNARWFARTASAQNGTYQYTALGIHDNYDVELATGQTAYAQGVGTWNDIEKISFSAELIDAYHKSAYRYFVSIAGSYGRMENTAISYPMVPDATNMVYSAYIPAGLGSSSTDLSFCRHNNYNQSLSIATYNNPNVSWPASVRGSSSTYYPVTESSSTSAGYWHLSVLVDGTYENLIYDTLTDNDGLGTAGANTGLLEYSLDGGASWTTLMNQGNTDDNRIDAYRWYVPCAEGTVVNYRWTPYYGADKLFGTYDDTVFYFEHDTSLGMYCVVTEAENEMTFNTTPVIRRSAANLSTTGFEAQVEESLAAAEEEE